MEEKLNAIWIGSFKLRVFYEGSRRDLKPKRVVKRDHGMDETKTRWRVMEKSQTKSYAKAIRNVGDVHSRMNHRKINHSFVDPIIKHDDNKCIVWEVSKDIAPFLKECLIGKVSSLSHLKSIYNLCSTEGLDTHCLERLVWLKVRGIPVLSWEERLFKKIGEIWGKVTSNEEEELGSENESKEDSD
ncbi:hypothetical protein Tco_1504543 [Tanacetum coccineum]